MNHRYGKRRRPILGVVRFPVMGFDAIIPQATSVFECDCQVAYILGISMC